VTKSVAVVSPHPDDETLGCGGTLFRHRDEGDSIHWIIVTTGLTPAQRERRKATLKEVERLYEFASVAELGFATTRLDMIPLSDLVASLHDAFAKVAAEIIYLPFRGDVHTDHCVVFDASVSALKWFRHTAIRRILAYETLSETEQAIDPDGAGFRPNVFVDIKKYLPQKLKALDCYSDETGPFPFPRSGQAVRALAQFRGATAGFEAAEAFVLLRERT